MDLDKILRGVISKVNSTLGTYEAEWISCKRTPDSEKEVCMSFEQFVEIRFNFECYKIPELQKLIEVTEGHLFSCTGLDDPDLVKRKFTLAHLEVLNPEMLPEEFEYLRPELDKVVEFLGGKHISFNNVKKKIKYTIE